MPKLDPIAVLINRLKDRFRLILLVELFVNDSLRTNLLIGTPCFVFADISLFFN